MKGKEFLLSSSFSIPISLRNFDLWLLNLSGHGKDFTGPLYAVVCFLQQTLPLSAGVNSSHDRAMISHTTTVGDSFLGAGGGGVVWESYLLKSTFVVVDLEIRLMRFNCTYEISLSCLLIRMWDNVISVSCERRCNYTIVQVV